MQKEGLLQRVLGFVEKKGFYIILGLCVLAIGVSGYVLFFTGSSDEPIGPQPETVSGQVEGIPAPVLRDETPSDDGEHRLPAKDPLAAPAQDPMETAQTSQTDAPPVQEIVPPDSIERLREKIFALPVRESEVTRAFSGEELVYDETMCDWRTHNGADFVCDEGDEVLAVLDGTVEKVWADPMWGHCLILDHGAGLQSKYCGLAANDLVKAGTQVFAGQTLGRAGGAIPMESTQPCHIHLEMTEGDMRVDPMSVLTH